jgi:hypothetical protein
MTTTPKDGGPAFPLQSIGPDFNPGYHGMTLRDWFAGQALAGIMGDMERAWSEAKATRQASMPDFLAGAAYRYADAMIAARETDND